ncbi:MAG: glycosyltransferase [Armatimonadetes bacterium]|nr:glycosyltransferase [Armatimonadota bacterium]
MKTPLVSIVLPTYNGSRYIEQAIESCLAQTYSNWELIIVDDASSDDTPAIIARYAGRESRIRTIRNSPNRKLPASLNIGFAQARGDYFTWTSDDNCFRPDALAEMSSYLQAHPEVDVLYTDYTNIDDEGQFVKYSSVGPREELVTRNCVGACFLYKRAVHEKLKGYAEDLFLAEDYDFWLRASVDFRLQPLHKDLYLYRRHSASLTDQHMERILLVTEQTLARSLPAMRWVSPADRIATHLRLARSARARKDMVMARNQSLQVLRYSPASFFRYGIRELAYIFLGDRLVHRLRSLYRIVRRHRADPDV